MSAREFQRITIDEDAYIRTDGFLFFLCEGKGEHPSQQNCGSVASCISTLFIRRLHSKSYATLVEYFHAARDLEKRLVAATQLDEQQALMAAECVTLRRRVEVLEEAILDANQTVKNNEGSDLSFYFDMDCNRGLSAKIIGELTSEEL